MNAKLIIKFGLPFSIPADLTIKKGANAYLGVVIQQDENKARNRFIAIRSPYCIFTGIVTPVINGYITNE